MSRIKKTPWLQIRLISVVLFLSLFSVSPYYTHVLADSSANSDNSSQISQPITVQQYNENIQGAKQVTAWQYLSLMNDRQAKFFAYIGFSGCPYCRALSPVTKQFISEAKLPVYYLNLTESFKDFPNSDLGLFWDTFNEPYEWEGTPTIALVVHGKIVEEYVGSDTTLQQLNALNNLAIELN
ncbi:PedC/BrcD family bacteriocin maturation disulfide isomerase [Furfurilactobacillus entadae]|uniref:PedC/BrcD family bacteriocin maturation disulfide isomerase n=1 Tax=Furfurilactobacillus entadae TaxID=2922307 RepID=UPI0035E4A75A